MTQPIDDILKIPTERGIEIGEDVEPGSAPEIGQVGASEMIYPISRLPDFIDGKLPLMLRKT